MNIGKIKNLIEWANLMLYEDCGIECRGDEDCDHCVGIQILDDAKKEIETIEIEQDIKLVDMHKQPKFEIGQIAWHIDYTKNKVESYIINRISLVEKEVRYLDTSRNVWEYGSMLYKTKEEAEKALEVLNEDRQK